MNHPIKKDKNRLNALLQYPIFALVTPEIGGLWYLSPRPHRGKQSIYALPHFNSFFVMFWGYLALLSMYGLK